MLMILNDDENKNREHMQSWIAHQIRLPIVLCSFCSTFVSVHNICGWSSCLLDLPLSFSSIRKKNDHLAVNVIRMWLSVYDSFYSLVGLLSSTSACCIFNRFGCFDCLQSCQSLNLLSIFRIMWKMHANKRKEPKGISVSRACFNRQMMISKYEILMR